MAGCFDITKYAREQSIIEEAVEKERKLWQEAVVFIYKVSGLADVEREIERIVCAQYVRESKKRLANGNDKMIVPPLWEPRNITG